MQIAIIIGIIVFLGFLLTAVKARNDAIVGIANVANTWKARVHAGDFQHADRFDAIQDLDSSIQDVFGYAVLRKLTGLAPLIGVLITVLLVYLSEAGIGSDTRASDALATLKPAFSGVAIGAFWAIVNQLIVLRVGEYARRTAASAIAQVDQSKIGSRYAVLGPFIRELEEFSRGIAGGQQLLVAMQGRLQEAATSVLGDCCAAMDRLEAAADTAANRLNDSSARHFEQMQRTTTEFSTAVDAMTRVISGTEQKVTLYLSHVADTNADARTQIDRALHATTEMVTHAQESLQEVFQNIKAASVGDRNALRSATEAALSASAASLNATIERTHKEFVASAAARDGLLAAVIGKSQASAEVQLNRQSVAVSDALVRLSGAAEGLTDTSDTVVQLRNSMSVTATALQAYAMEFTEATKAIRTTAGAYEAGRANALSVYEATAQSLEVTTRAVVESNGVTSTRLQNAIVSAERLVAEARRAAEERASAAINGGEVTKKLDDVNEQLRDLRIRVASIHGASQSLLPGGPRNAQP
jgi:hypothetical protein